MIEQITVGISDVVRTIQSHKKFQAAFSTSSPQNPVILGIAGGSCAGKGYVSNLILSVLHSQVLVLNQDDYYMGIDGHKTSDKVNWDCPEAMDFGLLESNLQDLRAGRIINKPNYDMRTHSRSAYEFVVPPSLVVIEGIFAFQSEIRPYLDITLFVSAPNNVRLARRINRDIKERGRTEQDILRQWRETVLPMHLKFVEPQIALADIIVNNSEFARTA